MQRVLPKRLDHGRLCDEADRVLREIIRDETIPLVKRRSALIGRVNLIFALLKQHQEGSRS